MRWKIWVLILGLGLLAACQAVGSPPVPTPTEPPPATTAQTLTPTATPTSTKTALPTLTASPQFTPTPTQPTFVREGTPIPPAEPITAENAGQLVELARLGKGRIVDVQLSPDRNYLLVQTTIGVYGYLADTQEEVWRFEDPSGIAAMAVPRLERWMAVATNDGQIALLIYRRGTMFTRWETGYADINGLAFSYEDDLLAAVGDRGVTVWEVGDTEPVYEYPEIWGGELIRFTPDGEGIILLNEARASIYDFPSGESHTKVEFFESGPPVFSEDGQYFSDGFAVWDGTTGEMKLKLDYEPIWMAKPEIAFSRDSSLVAVGLVGSLEVFIWDIGKEELVHHLVSPYNEVFTPSAKVARPAILSSPSPYFVTGLAFSPDSQEISIATGLGYMEVWDVYSGRYKSRSGGFGNVFYIKDRRVVLWSLFDFYQVYTTTGAVFQDTSFFDPLDGLVFSQDGEKLFTAYSVWDLNSLQMETIINFETVITVSEDNRTFYSFNQKESKIVERRIDNFEIVNETTLTFDGDFSRIKEPDLNFIREAMGYNGMRGVMITPDGRYFAGYIYDYGYFIWDLESNQVIEDFYHSGGFEAEFSKNGEFFMISTGDEMYLYKMYPEPRNTIATNIDYQYYSRFSGSQRSVILLSCGELTYYDFDGEGTLIENRIIDLGNDPCFYDFIAPMKEMVILLTGPDFYLVDISTGEKFRMANTHLDNIDDIAFSPDGRYIATSSWDGTIRIWGIPVEE